MSNEPIIESGLQLVTRLIDRTSVHELDNDLFFKGLKNTDMIEIQGTIDSGLIGLLYKLVTKCVLPKKYNGLNMDVLVINTENKFDVSKLYKNMYQEISDYEGPVKIDDVVQNLLNSVQCIYCYSHDQFCMTLMELDNILLKNKKVGMIVLDSLSAYYWQKKDESYNSYLMKMLKMIRKLLIDFKVIVVYTKQLDFASKKQTLEWYEAKKIVSYEINLSKCENTNKFICCVKSGLERKQLFYEFKNSIFTWSEVKFYYNIFYILVFFYIFNYLQSVYIG